MNWHHVHLIYMREMRDQLRDRRTLFTITVLPVLLYPLLGMLMMQVAQFKREQTVQVRIVGLENWPEQIPLVDSKSSGQRSDRFASNFMEEKDAKLVELELISWPASLDMPAIIDEQREQLADDQIDATLIIPPDFQQQLTDRINNSEASNKTDETKPSSKEEVEHAGLQIVANLARDRSQLAVRRVQNVLRDWQQQWIGKQLETAGLSTQLVSPLPIQHIDTSEKGVRRAMLWSKILPFIMLVWALTGAFYPAIDLCAGEKERGTLETLLSSPARRKEIVWGKLFTVATFSVLSALLNLLSMQMTAGFVVEQLASKGTPELAEAIGQLPVHAFGWLLLLLIPMSAFFSALALAVAALARSTKEGQYYLMPLLLFALPLVTMPMIPSLELNLATSMVPVSGAVFVVRSLIEGRFSEAFIHLPVVVGVTALSCLLAIRWAVRQFESESVMFSESERWSFQTWIKQVWRDRGEVASPSEAILCGLIILVAMFFSQFIAAPTELDWHTIWTRIVITQLA